MEGTPTPIEQTETDSRPSAQLLFYGAGIAGVLLIAGSLGPWVRLSGLLGGTLSVAGTQGDGIITLVLGVLVIALAILGIMREPGRRLVCGVMLLAGLIALGVFAYDGRVMFDGAGETSGVISVGWGLWLIGVGAIAAIAFAAFLLAHLALGEDGRFASPNGKATGIAAGLSVAALVLFVATAAGVLPSDNASSGVKKQLEALTPQIKDQVRGALSSAAESAGDSTDVSDGADLTESQDKCAKSMVKSMKAAADEYFTENDDSYKGMTVEDLGTIDPSITESGCLSEDPGIWVFGPKVDSEGCHGNPTSTGYCLVAKSETGTLFVAVMTSDGVRLGCSPAADSDLDPAECSKADSLDDW